MSTLEQRKPKIDKTHPSKLIYGANPNRNIPPEDLAFIRRLPDFDLIMFLSDMHDHGWGIAKGTLKIMRKSVADGHLELLPEA